MRLRAFATHFLKPIFKLENIPPAFSARRYVPALNVKAAFAEINWFSATGTGMGPIELVGEDFLFSAAFRALADEGTQITQILESRAVCRFARFLWHAKPPVRVLAFVTVGGKCLPVITPWDTRQETRS